MKMKTSELSGIALDWAVAKCEFGDDMPAGFGSRSADWAQAGPIIEREKIAVEQHPGCEAWVSFFRGVIFTGPTPLIAAMRCYVASKLGDDVEIPEGLIECRH
jgi:hypothetical protein